VETSFVAFIHQEAALVEDGAGDRSEEEMHTENSINIV
jgi:hypothetical protein